MTGSEEDRTRGPRQQSGWYRQTVDLMEKPSVVFVLFKPFPVILLSRRFGMSAEGVLF